MVSPSTTWVRPRRQGGNVVPALKVVVALHAVGIRASALSGCGSVLAARDVVGGSLGVHIDLGHQIVVHDPGDHALKGIVLIVAGQTAGSGGLAGAVVVQEDGVVVGQEPDPGRRS